MGTVSAVLWPGSMPVCMWTPVPSVVGPRESVHAWPKALPDATGSGVPVSSGAFPGATTLARATVAPARSSAAAMGPARRIRFRLTRRARIAPSPPASMLAPSA